MTLRLPASVAVDSSDFAAAWLAGEAERWLPRRPSRDADWAERIEELRASPSPAREVWERAAREGDRLGADHASRSSAQALAAGEALCVTTGQQPGLLLGPLYTVYKAMTAVALAQALSARAGRPVVPVFWNAADDSDFAEVNTTCLPLRDLALSAHALDGAELPAGAPVGGLGTEGTKRVLEKLRDEFAARPGGPGMLRHLDQALERAEDHGALATALLLDLLQGTGLVVVDARWPELRRAAAPLWRRWAGQREAAARRIVETGTALTAAGFRAPIQEASTRNALFDVRSGRRLPFEGSKDELLARIESAPETLAPNVTLRPLVQDSLFPNVATVGGPSEIAYHAQLAAEYELLEVRLPVLFPRFAATLVPPGVHELAARRREPLASFVQDFDGTMRATGERALPDGLRSAVEALDRLVSEGLDGVSREAEPFDTKLASAVAEARRRVSDALERLREKAATAARAADARRDPRVHLYREFLKPRGVPQERVLSALTLFLESEAHPLDCLREALSAHVAAVLRGELRHWLLDFGGAGTGGGS